MIWLKSQKLKIVSHLVFVLPLNLRFQHLKKSNSLNDQLFQNLQIAKFWDIHAKILIHQSNDTLENVSFHLLQLKKKYIQLYKINHLNFHTVIAIDLPKI